MTEELDPRAALALADQARERLARRAATPGWYAPLYGLGCGLIVAGGGAPRPWGMVLLVFGLLGVVLLYQHWTNKSGLSVNGYRAGKTRLIAFALVAVMVALLLAGMMLREEMGLIWAPFLCGAVAAVLAALASAAWDRAWQAQIRRGEGQ